MRSAPVSLTVVGLLVAALAVLPLPAASFVPSTPLSGLFLSENETGAGILAFQPPTNPEPETLPAGLASSPVDGVPGACVQVPAVLAAPTCTAAILGSAVAPVSFQVVGDGILELWLSTDAPALPIVDVVARLEHVNATGATAEVYQFQYASDGRDGPHLGPRASAGSLAEDTVLTLDQEPRRIALTGARAETLNVTAGDTLRLVLDAVVTPITGAVAQILVHYGSGMPSGTVFEVGGADAWRVQFGTNTLAILLRDDNVTFYPLDNETDQVRAFSAAGAAGATLPSFESPASLTWGPTRLDEGTHVVGSGFAELYVQTAASGPPNDKPPTNAEFAVDVTLQFDDQSFRGASSLAVVPAAGQGLTRLVVPIRGAPFDLEPGMNVSVTVDLFALNATKFSIVHGSINHTSGVFLPVLGGGIVRPIVLSDPLPFLNAPPPETTGGPETEGPAATDEPRADEEQLDSNEEGSSGNDAEDDITLREMPAKGRSPGPPGGFLFTVLLVGALLARRGRVGKPS